MTFDEVYKPLRDKYRGVFLKLAEFIVQNPEADFRESIDCLKIAHEHMLFALCQQLFESDDARFIETQIGRAYASMQEVATVDCKRRFEAVVTERGINPIFKKVIGWRGDTFAALRRHRDARNLYLTAMTRIEWATTNKRRREVVQEAERLLENALDEKGKRFLKQLRDEALFGPAPVPRVRSQRNPYAVPDEEVSNVGD